MKVYLEKKKKTKDEILLSLRSIRMTGKGRDSGPSPE
jgi:hypothetical protein